MGHEDVLLTRVEVDHVDKLPAIAYALAISHLSAAFGKFCILQLPEGMAKAQFLLNSLVSGVEADQ